MNKASLHGHGTLRSKIRSIPYPWVVVGLALASQLAGAWPNQGLPTIYYFIQEDLGLSQAQVGLITSALMGGGIATVFLGGWLADVIGVRRVMVFSLFALGLLMGAFPLVHSLPAILVLGAVVGMAEGPGYPASTRAIMDWLPRRTRGLAMSIKQTGVPLGGAIAAAMLPAVAQAAGWQMAALAMGGLILLVGVAMLAFYRDAPRERVSASRMTLASLRVLTRNRGLVLATLWGTTFVALQFIFLTYFILFLINGLGISPVVAGWYMAMAFITSAVARLLWGAASDFLFGTRRVVVLGILGMATTMALVGASLAKEGMPWVAVLLVFALGATTISWHGVFTILVGELAGAARTGTAIGAVNTVMRVSMITIPPLFGLIVDITGTYSIAWGAAAALALTSTLALVAFGRDPLRQ